MEHERHPSLGVLGHLIQTGKIQSLPGVSLLMPPPDQDSIVREERVMGVVLPPFLKGLYRLCNGGAMGVVSLWSVPNATLPRGWLTLASGNSQLPSSVNRQYLAFGTGDGGYIYAVDRASEEVYCLDKNTGYGAEFESGSLKQFFDVRIFGSQASSFGDDWVSDLIEAGCYVTP